MYVYVYVKDFKVRGVAQQDSGTLNRTGAENCWSAVKKTKNSYNSVETNK